MPFWINHPFWPGNKKADSGDLLMEVQKNVDKAIGKVDQKWDAAWRKFHREHPKVTADAWNHARLMFMTGVTRDDVRHAKGDPRNADPGNAYVAIDPKNVIELKGWIHGEVFKALDWLSGPHAPFNPEEDSIGAA